MLFLHLVEELTRHFQRVGVFSERGTQYLAERERRNLVTSLEQLFLTLEEESVKIEEHGGAFARPSSGWIFWPRQTMPDSLRTIAGCLPLPYELRRTFSEASLELPNGVFSFDGEPLASTLVRT